MHEVPSGRSITVGGIVDTSAKQVGEDQSGEFGQTGRFCRCNSTKMSFTEFWRETRSPAVLIGWLTKVLRIKVPGSPNDPNVVSLRPFMVDAGRLKDHVPAKTMNQVRPILRELSDMGFGSPVCYHFDDAFHGADTVQIAVTEKRGRSIARVVVRREGVNKTKVTCYTEFISGLTDGAFICSSSAKAQMFWPDQCELNWLPGSTLSKLWISHKALLEADSKSPEQFVILENHVDIEKMLERHHEVIRDFQLARGVFESMQGEDLAQTQALDERIAAAKRGEVRNPEILAHIDRLQRRRMNGMSAVVMLLISVLLFIAFGAGAWNWSVSTILVVVAILFVHELGHFLAMKIFGYRNVRMFFIPLFGAAVSGENYAAPGWKKVIVSLMGPLPGIYIGSALGIAGLVWGNEAVMRLALAAVALNGLQLLPVVPLDGGRVLQTILFSRNYYLNSVFFVIAALSVMVLGGLTGTMIMTGFGAALLVAVPMVHRQGKLAAELRAEKFAVGSSVVARAVTLPMSGSSTDLPPSSITDENASMSLNVAPVQTSSEQRIPEHLAQTIADRVVETNSKIKSPKQLANIVLQVYERMVERPPGILASLAFAFLYGVSLLVVLIVGGLLFFMQNEGFRNQLARYSGPAAYAVAPAEIEIWCESQSNSRLSSIPTSEPPRQTIIATFRSSRQARTFYDEVVQSQTEEGCAVQLGSSMLLSFPENNRAGIDNWFSRIEQQTDKVFIEGATGTTAMLRLTYRLPAGLEGKRVGSLIDGYFDAGSSLYLIPPWIDPSLDQRSETEKQAHEAARMMYAELHDAGYPIESEELEQLQGELDRAVRRNNTDESERLHKKYDELYHKLHLEELYRIRNSADAPIKRKIADIFIDDFIAQRTKDLEMEDASHEELTDEEWEKQYEEKNAQKRAIYGPLMGMLPMDFSQTKPTFEDLRYSVNYGYGDVFALTNGQLSVLFENTQIGLPAMLKWMKEQGCYDFRYEFVNDVGDY